MDFLSYPRLPESPINTVVMSGEHPEFIKRLSDIGITAIATAACKSLPRPVAHHADMQLCDFGSGHAFALKESLPHLKKQLDGMQIHETERRAQPIYPCDVLCSCIILDGCLFGRLDSLDPAILKYAAASQLTPVHVKQGYAACSCCVIRKNAVITEDPSIAAAMRQQGIDVLKISSGSIRLPGYDTGFIGGCSGKISGDTMVFSGDLKKHADFEIIAEFLKRYNVKYICLSDEQLLDIGGIVPVMED